MKSPFILAFIGSSIIILALMHFFGITQISSLAMFGFSISAFLFTTSDLLEEYMEKVCPSKKIVRTVSNIPRFFAVLSIIIFPYIEIDVSSVRINDFLTLLSLGLIITSLSFKDLSKWKGLFRDLRKITEDFKDIPK